MDYLVNFMASYNFVKPLSVSDVELLVFALYPFVGHKIRGNHSFWAKLFDECVDELKTHLSTATGDHYGFIFPREGSPTEF